MEIHQTLSPDSGSQQQAQEAPKDDTLTIDELANLIKSASAIGVREGMTINTPIHENVRKRQRSNSPATSIGADSDHSDLPSRGSGDAHEETVPLKKGFWSKCQY